MTATPFEFELGDIAQGAPLELADRGGGGVLLRLRKGTPITPRLVGQLNDLLSSDDVPNAAASDSRWWVTMLVVVAIVAILGYRTLRGSSEKNPPLVT